MALMPGAEWRPVRNHSNGGMPPIKGVVLHHMVGSDESAEARFNDPSSSASAHFGVLTNGEIHQYVDTANVAWHGCQANWGWIGIENESPGWDNPDTPQNELWDPLTPEQVAANGRILRWAHEAHGVPIQVTDSINVGGVAYHSMNPGSCSSAWGNTGCPGPLVVGQRAEIVSIALGEEPIDQGEVVMVYRTTDNKYWIQCAGGYQEIDSVTAYVHTLAGAKFLDNLHPLTLVSLSVNAKKVLRAALA